MEQHIAIAAKFEIAGNISEIKPLGPGFINDTFIVKTAEGKKIYIPVVKEFVLDVDMENKVVKVTLPEGLLDL